MTKLYEVNIHLTGGGLISILLDWATTNKVVDDHFSGLRRTVRYDGKSRSWNGSEYRYLDAFAWFMPADVIDITAEEIAPQEAKP